MPTCLGGSLELHEPGRLDEVPERPVAAAGRGGPDVAAGASPQNVSKVTRQLTPGRRDRRPAPRPAGAASGPGSCRRGRRPPGRSTGRARRACRAGRPGRAAERFASSVRTPLERSRVLTEPSLICLPVISRAAVAVPAVAITSPSMKASTIPARPCTTRRIPTSSEIACADGNGPRAPRGAGSDPARPRGPRTRSASPGRTTSSARRRRRRGRGRRRRGRRGGGCCARRTCASAPSR